MQILKEAPECYIQQCRNCGAVLKYSECDIHVGNLRFNFKDKDGNDVCYVCRDDSFVCPSCCHVNEAKRKWLIE